MVSAIAVAAFLVYAVDDNVDFQATLLDVLNDASEDVLVSVTLTHNIDVGVRVFHQQECVGDQTNGRRVNDDVIVQLLQLGEEFGAFVGSDQLSRIGRDGTGSDEVEGLDLS